MKIDQKRAAFEAHYDELFDLVYKFVAYRIPNRVDAEDVVANTVEKAYRKIRQFDPARGELRQWISGIARNEVTAHWRSSRPVVSLDQLGPIEDLSPPMDGRISDEIMVEHLMENLPAEAKALLTMRYVDDLTYREIARCIHKRPAAVRKWFSRMHKRLQIQLNKVYES
ncbi:RNA polymerase sigma factor [Candidatus Uhrbacteria bacterium]|jgi:RNA polymerase sigma-70 factor, ECF subfamily|nr:RNA polymerase sigma factor [Candidatus Uhrbacteria bacterium]